MKLKTGIEVFLPDTRGVFISRFGKGNLKIGPNVVTYSKAAIRSCPGSTPWCREHCYAQRITSPVLDVHLKNTFAGAEVPELPEGTELMRMHVDGDFDSVAYIDRWFEIVSKNPFTEFWAYTRSWSVSELLPALERLRALSNMQLFASVDESTTGLPPEGWRVAWIDGDPRATGLVCPEERQLLSNCEACGYCFHAPKQKRDVIFLQH